MSTTCTKEFTLTIGGWDVTWNSEVDNGGVNFPTPTGWPDDWVLAHPCVADPFDAFMWPVDWETRTPSSAGSSVVFGPEWIVLTLDSGLCSVEPYCSSGSIFERLYMRRLIDATLVGKHLHIEGNWTFPGGTWIDGVDLMLAAFNFTIGSDSCLFAATGLIGDIVVPITRQEFPDSGTFDVTYDVLLGETKYVCLYMDNTTELYGPSVVNFKMTVTDI